MFPVVKNQCGSCGSISGENVFTYCWQPFQMVGSSYMLQPVSLLLLQLTNYRSPLHYQKSWFQIMLFAVMHHPSREGRLDLLKPNLEISVCYKQTKQKVFHDYHATDFAL